MWCQRCRVSAFITWTILVVVVCHTEATGAQEPDGQAHDPVVRKQAVDSELVDSQEMTKALQQVERALQRVKRRAAVDTTLEHLANATIRDDGYAKVKGYSKGGRLVISASTDDKIEIPTRGAPAKVPGEVGIHAEYLGKKPDPHTHSGLHNGGITWKTNNPRVFVGLFWCSNDSGAPDRLLTILREELDREGLRLLPMHKLNWPSATASERLSQLLPPDFAPTVAPRTETVAASPQSHPIVFASPRDVVAARNGALAKKDWQAYALCQTPAALGSDIREVLFLVQMGGKKCPELIKTIEKHLKFKLYNDNHPGAFAQSKEVQEFWESSGRQHTEESEAADAWLYEVFRKRVGDVPAFLADCLRQLPDGLYGDDKQLECEGFRIEGDKASGYQIDRRPVPALEEVEKHPDASDFLPRYFPIRFRRIGGTWLIAFTFGHEE